MESLLFFVLPSRWNSWFELWFDVCMHFLLISQNESFHEIQFNGMTSFMESMLYALNQGIWCLLYTDFWEPFGEKNYHFGKKKDFLVPPSPEKREERKKKKTKKRDFQQKHTEFPDGRFHEMCPISHALFHEKLIFWY